MPDLADIAQEQRERAYERWWSEHQTTQRAIDDEGRPHDCIDCGERIPQARVNLGYCLRCVDCQEVFEKGVKR